MHLIDELSDQFHIYIPWSIQSLYTMYSSSIYKKFKTYSKNPIFAGPTLLLLCPSLKIDSNVESPICIIISSKVNSRFQRILQANFTHKQEDYGSPQSKNIIFDNAWFSYGFLKVHIYWHKYWIDLWINIYKILMCTHPSPMSIKSHTNHYL